MKTENITRITLIDDDFVSHLIATRMIKLFTAFLVESFTDPRDALEQISVRSRGDISMLPDIILLDINMPYMDGWEFLEEFEKLPDNLTQNVTVFILSSSNHSDDIQKSKTFKSVKDYISKPLTEEKIRMLENLVIR